MTGRKSEKRVPLTIRSATISEHEQIHEAKENDEDQQHERSLSNPEAQTTVVVSREETPVPSKTRRSTSSNVSGFESNRSRSKTISANTSDTESAHNSSNQLATTGSAGYHFLQSIKDLANQELNRVNPLGLLGKEIISVTGTTHCPEPIPPEEDEDESTINPAGALTSVSTSPNRLSAIDENEPQQIHFPLNAEEKRLLQRRRSTIANLVEETLPPCPAEFLSNSREDDLQPHLFSQPSPTTMVADFIPNTMSINVFEVFIYAWGVCAFFLDMVTDLVLAHAYYQEGSYWLFILTLMCVIVPNLTLSIFSLVWYMDSNQLKAAANEQQSSTQYETNITEEMLDKDPPAQHRATAKDLETVPLHEKRSSFCQTDLVNGEDQLDTHVSRDRLRPQTPDKDLRRHSSAKQTCFQFSTASASVFTWIIRIIILVLQLDLCLKYIRGLYYTWKGFQKRHNPKWARFYLTKQILIDADIALLRVFDCFMDSGSQVTLQLYIMLRLGSASTKYDTLFLKQCLSIFSSLGSLAYALSGYSRCWRHMQLTHSPQGWPKDKPPPQLVSWWSTIIQWLWYLFLITPRVLALAMFAATFRSWFWIILIAHWCGMLFWILRFRTIFCISDQTVYNPREAIFEKCYNLVCSYIFIFCYMNLRKGDTRTHYIAFYTIYYIENIAFSIIYAIHSAETNLVLKYSLVTFVCAGFWVAVFFQFLYYRFLHPSTHVRLSTKENLSSFTRIRPFPRLERLKKSKSCEEMIDHNSNENNELAETTSLHGDTKINERWHNRFSKENRQKLISQQQAIDQKVKITRVQKHLEEAMNRQRQSSNRFFTKLSTTLKRPTTITTSILPETDDSTEVIINQPVSSSAFAKSPHQQQSKMYNIDEDSHLTDENRLSTSSPAINTISEGGDEMILTAAKLTSHILPSSATSKPI